MTKYCTLQDVEAELRASENFTNNTLPSKTQVENWIEQESEVISNMTGEEYGRSSVSNLYYNYNGNRTLSLEKSPIVSIDSLEYNSGSIREPSWTTLTEDEDFTVLEDMGQIKLLPGFNAKVGLKRFRITYDYGYNNVPARIEKYAAKAVSVRVLETLLSSDLNTDNAGSRIEVGSIKIVKPSDYGASNFKMLKQEVREFKQNLGGSVKTFRPNVYT